MKDNNFKKKMNYKFCYSKQLFNTKFDWSRKNVIIDISRIIFEFMIKLVDASMEVELGKYS